MWANKHLILTNVKKIIIFFIIFGFMIIVFIAILF